MNKFRFVSFDVMLTPKIITFVYRIALIVFLILGICAFCVEGFLPDIHAFTIESFLIGAAIIVAGGFVWRIWCEFLIVIFKMNENLQRIADRTAGGGL